MGDMRLKGDGEVIRFSAKRWNSDVRGVTGLPSTKDLEAGVGEGGGENADAWSRGRAFVELSVIGDCMLTSTPAAWDAPVDAPGRRFRLSDAFPRRFIGERASDIRTSLGASLPPPPPPRGTAVAPAPDLLLLRKDPILL
jgi:hypothetical protein